MKLNNLFESAKQLLTEGLRFGRKEIQQVERESRDFRIGIEYEYHVDEDVATGTDGEYSDEYWEAVVDRAVELIAKDVEKKKESFVEEAAAADMDIFDVESGTAALTTIKTHAEINSDTIGKIYGNEDDFHGIMEEWDGENPKDLSDDQKEVIENYITNLKKIEKDFDSIRLEIQSLEDENQLDRWVHIIGDREIGENLEDVKKQIDDFSNWTGQISNINNSDYTKIKDEFDVYYKEIEELSEYLDMITDLSGDDKDWDRDIHQHFEESAEESWEDEKETYLGYNPEDWPDSPFEEQARQEIDEEGEYSPEGDIAEAIEENIQNDYPSIFGDIEKFTVDPSVDNGAETITKPLPLKRALEVMEIMFDHIHEVGSTSNQTGMHVNMSIKGLNFKKDNFNPAKLVMLLDPKTLAEFFPLRKQYTENLLNTINGDFLWIAAEQRNTELLIQYFNLYAVDQGKKYQQANFITISEVYSEHLHRIEFRYFGGKDYEDRFNTIKWNIYRTAYILMVAYAEEFGQKEYLKAMVKILDEKSEELFKVGFDDVVKYRKNNPKDDMFDFVSSMTIDKPGIHRKLAHKFARK